VDICPILLSLLFPPTRIVSNMVTVGAMEIVGSWLDEGAIEGVVLGLKLGKMLDVGLPDAPVVGTYEAVGVGVGGLVGGSVGPGVGGNVGNRVGNLVGGFVGPSVGSNVGDNVGENVGDLV